MKSPRVVKPYLSVNGERAVGYGGVDVFAGVGAVGWVAVGEGVSRGVVVVGPRWSGDAIPVT